MDEDIKNAFQELNARNAKKDNKKQESSDVKETQESPSEKLGNPSGALLKQWDELNSERDPITKEIRKEEKLNESEEKSAIDRMLETNDIENELVMGKPKVQHEMYRMEVISRCCEALVSVKRSGGLDAQYVCEKCKKVCDAKNRKKVVE